MAEDLLRSLLAIEARFGRTRDGQSFGYQDRSLDLDLLYYGDMATDSPELTLPHPRIGDRLFVLAPLCELEPEFRDILNGKAITEMVEELKSRIMAGKLKNQEIIVGSWD